MNDDDRLVRALRVTFAGVTVALGALLATAQDGNPQGTPRLTIQEADGSPSVRVRTLSVANGTLTDDGGGTVSFATPASTWASSLTAGAASSGTSPILTAGDELLGSANEIVLGNTSGATAPVGSFSIVLNAAGTTLDVSASNDAGPVVRTDVAGGLRYAATAGSFVVSASTTMEFATDTGSINVEPAGSFVVSTPGSVLIETTGGGGGFELTAAATMDVVSGGYMQIGDDTVTDSVTVDTAGPIVLDSTTTTSIVVGSTSEVLTVTGGSNTITIDAGTGSALTISSALDTTLAPTGGDVRVTDGTRIVAGTTTSHTIALCGLVTLVDGAATTVCTFTTTDGTWVGAVIYYVIESVQTTTGQTLTGSVVVSIYDDASGVTAGSPAEGTQLLSAEGGSTLTDVWSVVTTDDGSIEVQLLADTSLTPTTFRARIQVIAPTAQAVSVP